MLGLAAWLLDSYGVGRILDLLGHAGWFGILTVIAFHLVQVLFSAMGWRVIAGPTMPRPSLRTFMVMRWIREAVNNLLPVAQIGGEFVVARLLQRWGMKLAPAIAGTVADLTMEMVTQILFTLLGLALLLHSVGDGGIAGYVISGLLVAALVAVGFLGAQWFGLASGDRKRPDAARPVVWLEPDRQCAGAARRPDRLLPLAKPGGVGGAVADGLLAAWRGRGLPRAALPGA